MSPGVLPRLPESLDTDARPPWQAPREPRLGAGAGSRDTLEPRRPFFPADPDAAPPPPVRPARRARRYPARLADPRP
jgi:hypothetical protein